MELTQNEQKFSEDTSSLWKLIYASDTEDLDILVDYITDKGEGRIALDGNICKQLVRCKNTKYYDESDRNLIIEEVRRFGGNSIANVIRDLRNAVSYGSVLDNILPDAGGAVTYKEIVCDVAEHMKVPFSEDSTVSFVEQGILIKILQSSYEKMSSEERALLLKELGIADLSMLKPGATAILIGAAKLGGFKTYQLALIVANAVARALLGKGLSFATNRMVTKIVSIATGPIGWIITGLWTAADMASPAYRVTVPCVVQIAFMRQKLLAKISSKTCGSCETLNTLDSKFCTACGTAI